MKKIEITFKYNNEQYGVKANINNGEDIEDLLFMLRRKIHEII